MIIINNYKKKHDLAGKCFKTYRSDYFRNHLTLLGLTSLPFMLYLINSPSTMQSELTKLITPDKRGIRSSFI